MPRIHSLTRSNLSKALDANYRLYVMLQIIISEIIITCEMKVFQSRETVVGYLQVCRSNECILLLCMSAVNYAACFQ